MKVKLQRRLGFRLAFKQTLTFALLVIVLAWSAYALLTRHIYDRIDEELQDRAIAVRSMLQIRANDVHWLNEQADPEVSAQFAKSIRYYQLLDDKGKVVESSPEMATLNLPFSSAARQALQSEHNVWEFHGSPGEDHLRILNVPVAGLKQQQYVMRIGVSLDDADDDSHRLGLYLLLLLPFIILAHALNAWIMATSSLRPLEELSAAAKQITPFDLSQRLPVSGRNDELDDLAASMNTTIARVQSSFQRMSEFLRTLSHEIRQPLTVLRAETEQALRMGNERDYQDTLSKQLEHVELLARTVSDLMELAKSESEQIKLQREKEDLSELVQAAIDGMRPQAAERGVAISGTVQRNIVGAFDAGQIWRLLLNLLDNAIKFNHSGGKVDVSVSVVNEMAMISISDTGSGIAAEEQTHVFERGYRTAAARKSSVPGTGLGLHFARVIAEAHGGNIEVHSVPGEGSCFHVSLPLRSVGENNLPSVQRDATVN
jgi:heavy metal sensor kinase